MPGETNSIATQPELVTPVPARGAVSVPIVPPEATPALVAGVTEPQPQQPDLRTALKEERAKRKELRALQETLKAEIAELKAKATQNQSAHVDAADPALTDEDAMDPTKIRAVLARQQAAIKQQAAEMAELKRAQNEAHREREAREAAAQMQAMVNAEAAKYQAFADPTVAKLAHARLAELVNDASEEAGGPLEADDLADLVQQAAREADAVRAQVRNAAAATAAGPKLPIQPPAAGATAPGAAVTPAKPTTWDEREAQAIADARAKLAALKVAK